MTSERSCDIDWRNDAENSALPSQEYIWNIFKKVMYYLQYYCFYCILDQINAGLVSIRDIFKKLGKYYWRQTFKW